MSAFSPAEAARLNAKYDAFYVTRYSPKSGRFLQIGKPCRTIEEAGRKAMRADRDGWMAFVDYVKPERKD